MKKHYIFIIAALICSGIQAQNIASNTEGVTLAGGEDQITTPSKDIDNNGFKFEAFQTGINSKYADYGIGFFKEKFISFSARKIGGFVKKDPATNQPYTKLYCSDITYEWDLNRPLLFSHILNKNDNLGTLSFSKDGNRLYFTKSTKKNSQVFQLYTAEMNPKREGEFINMKALPFNSDSYSVENPHLSRDGKTLFFASNMPEAIGGFDIFKVTVNDDGTHSAPQRVEGSVNTVLDEKFPQTSLDGKYLYFSSKGHNNVGGFDVFRSRHTDLGYVATRNLGNTINTEKDEIAFISATETVGYITSDRDGGKGSYDIYKITEYVVDQFVQGQTVDLETGIPLADATVVLVDADGTEVATLKSDTNGNYIFPVDAFLEYTLLAYKEGFERGSTSFNTNTNLVDKFDTKVALEAKAAEIIETEEKAFIQIDNILFDYDKAIIKPVSTITLNTVVQTLMENPSLKIAINAHTDKQGSSAYNLALSEKRAAAALTYITKKGIARERLISKGYGESQLLITCNPCSKKQHETNRRIEFLILKEE